MPGVVTFTRTVVLCGLVLCASTAVLAQPRHDTVGHLSPADAAERAVREPKDIKVPGLLGSGNVPELNRAAEADRVLTRLALAFARAPESADLDTLMRDVLWRWTKASRHNPASRGAAMADARWLYFVEAFEGKPYRREQGPRRGSPKPTPLDAALICARADKLAEFHYAQMMLSTHLADLNDRMKVTWRPDVNAFSFDFSEVASMLAEYAQAHPSEGPLKIARYARALAGLNMLDENAIAQLESGLKPLGPEVTGIVTASRKKLVRECAVNSLHGLVEAGRFGSAWSGISGSRPV